MQAARAPQLELGGGGRGRAVQSSPGNVLKSIQKFRAARAQKEKKGHNPPLLWALRVPTSPFGLHLQLQCTRFLRLLWSLAVGWAFFPCSSLQTREAAGVLALLFGAPCPTTTHSASPRHRRKPRTPPGHRRRARPASAKEPGRCRGRRAPGAAAAAPARGRRGWALRARNPRGCPSARDAGTTAMRRRSRATSASACGGTASARSAT